MTELDLMSHSGYPGPHQPDPYQPGPNQPGPHPPEPRRSGAGRAIAAAAVAAVLASGLTAGALIAFDRPGSATPATSPTATTASPVSALTSTGKPDWVAVSAAVAPSVVAVRVDLGNGSGDEGSGVVLDKSGHILTNNHVIADAAGGAGTITVTLADGRIYPASVVGTDPSTDLAVLRMATAPADLRPATFGDSSAVKVGDPVMAIGNPLGLADTVTTGIVSALNRPISTTPDSQQPSNPFGSAPQAEPVVTNAIQTDAAVNPGNSGGALVDAAGHVIGITSSIASLDSGGSGQSGSIGLGFAIPSDEAKDVADQLIADGKVRHAYLGVTIGDGTATVDGAKREAAVISAVGAGTPAAAAGLRAGDAVVALDGAPVEGADSLIGQIRALDPGTKVTLTVVRGGNSQTVTVTLAASPSGQ